MFKLNFLIFSFFLSIFVSGQSLSLAEIYELALDKDPELKIAEATYRAEKEAKAKGIAGLLPSLTTRGITSWNESEVLRGSQSTFFDGTGNNRETKVETISASGINTEQIYDGERIENKKLEPYKVLEKRLRMPAPKIYNLIKKGTVDEWMKALKNEGK